MFANEIFDEDFDDDDAAASQLQHALENGTHEDYINLKETLFGDLDLDLENTCSMFVTDRYDEGDWGLIS